MNLFRHKSIYTQDFQTKRKERERERFRFSTQYHSIKQEKSFHSDFIQKEVLVQVKSNKLHHKKIITFTL